MTDTARAAVLRGVGQPLEVHEVVLDEPAPHQVVVRLAASGVCHSDLSVQQGRLPFMFPCVPGHEGSGVVERVGAAVTRVAVGDHVALTWLPPCRRCAFCLGGQPFLCENGLSESLSGPYLTLDGAPLVRGLGVGSFATKTIVPEGSVVPVDKALDLELVALVGCALSTGVGAVIRTAQVPAGASVAVLGCGGVGLSAVQGARLAGCRMIVAVDKVASKLELARQMGATHAVDASAGDPVAAVRELVDGRGPDYTFEVVGRADTIKQAFAMTRRGGTTVVVGAGSPDDPVTFSAMDLFIDAKALVGCIYGSVDADRDFPVLLDLMRAGRIDGPALVSRRIGLDEINDAMEAMLVGDVARTLVVF